MKLLSQPFDGQLGEYLRAGLESERFNTLNIAVAFAKNSGVLRLREPMQRFRDAGGEIKLYLGVDLSGTSYEALSNLLPVATALKIFHDENGQTFHTKLFNFVADGSSELVVGSHNLTAGGLWTNFESSILLGLDHGDPAGLALQQEVNAYFTRLDGSTDTIKVITCDDHIRELLDNQYIEKDVKQRVRRRQASASASSRSSLFGASQHANLPSLPSSPTRPMGSTPSASAPPVPQAHPAPSFLPTRPSGLTPAAQSVADTEDPTLWLETRKMTGGSRNILDLSKKSLVRSGNVSGTPYSHQQPGFMRGAVEFFGIDPEEIDFEKEITINFEGIDFIGNTIKFPVGPHANGTWRVQMKGISATGLKITSVFKRLANGGDLLPNKIVSFTRLHADYYYLSVFEESELSAFLTASTITAYNGRNATARHLGIF